MPSERSFSCVLPDSISSGIVYFSMNRFFRYGSPSPPLYVILVPLFSPTTFRVSFRQEKFSRIDTLPRSFPPPPLFTEVIYLCLSVSWFSRPFPGWCLWRFGGWGKVILLRSLSFSTSSSFSILCFSLLSFLHARHCLFFSSTYLTFASSLKPGPLA